MGLVSLPFFCCGSGFAGLIAAVLGVFALERIAWADGALRGKGWAWTGLVSGLVSITLSLAWMSFANSALQDWNQQLDDGLRQTFAATTDESAREAVQAWAGRSGPGVSAATLTAFATDVRERLGELQTVSLISQDASTGSLQALVVVHVVHLEFESESRSAVVTTELRTPVLSWMPRLKLVKIQLSDATRAAGAIEFPEPSAKPQATTREAAASEAGPEGDKEVAP